MMVYVTSSGEELKKGKKKSIQDSNGRGIKTRLELQREAMLPTFGLISGFQGEDPLVIARKMRDEGEDTQREMTWGLFEKNKSSIK